MHGGQTAGAKRSQESNPDGGCYLPCVLPSGGSGGDGAGTRSLRHALNSAARYFLE